MRYNYTSSELMIVGLGGLGVCCIVFTLRDVVGRVLESPAVAMGMTFAIPGLLFFSLNKVLIFTLNGLRNMRAFAVFQAIRYLFILAGVTAIMLLGYPDAYLPLSLTIAEVFLFVALTLCINLHLFHFRFSLSSEMASWFKRHISLGSRGFLSGVLIEMNTRVDVIMLGYFMRDSMVGIYSFGATFAEAFAQLSTIMRQNVNPIVGLYFAEGNREKIPEFSSRIRRVFVPVMALLGGTLVAFFPVLLKLIASGDKASES